MTMQVGVGFVNISAYKDILSPQMLVYEPLKVRVTDRKIRFKL